MAAPRHDHARSGQPRLRGSNTSSPLRDSPRLPTGACHFKELSVADSAPRCGCRRFWTRNSSHGGDAASPTSPAHSSSRPWCMCGHHACFHDPDTPTCSSAVKGGSISDHRSRTSPVKEAIGSLVLELLQRPSWSSRAFQPGVFAERNGDGEVQDDEARHTGAADVYDPRTRDSRVATPVRSHGRLGGAPTMASPAAVVETPRRTEYGPIPRIRSRDGLARLEVPDAASQALGMSLPDRRLATPSDGSPTGRQLASPRLDSPLSAQPGRPGSRTVEASRKPFQAATRSSDARPCSSDSPKSRPSPRQNNGEGRNRQYAAADRPALSQHASRPAHPPAKDAGHAVTEPGTPRRAGTPDVGAESRVSMSELSAIIYELDQVDERHGAMNGGGSGPPLGRSRLPGVQDAGERGETADSEVHQSSTVPLLDFPYSQHAQDRSTVSQTLRRLLPRLDVLMTRTTAYPSLVRALEIHASRLEALENASISNAPFEDVWDRIDLMDGRVTHVEVRADDLEKWRAACDEEEQSLENALGHRRCRDGAHDHLGRDGSFLSTGSAGTHTSKSHSTALVAAAHDLAEVRSRLAAVEARLSRVEQTLPPSPERPWLVEVIMLPWGRDLRGIWFLADSAADATSGTAEWTQSREVAGGSRTNSFHQNGEDGAVWTGRSIAQWAQDADLWTSARACGTRSRVYRRLKSRGLVQDVHVTGASAKDFEDAVLEAFGGTPEAMSGDPGVWADEHSASQDSDHDCGVLGLRSPYIPLRKIHRDSRLRFLSPAEMVTPAMWNAEFLESSVVMKPRDGPHRLFVTHRGGYLQDAQRNGADWTWQKLKQLPKAVAQRRRPDGHATSVAEADAPEPCWEWDARLDASASTVSSFTHDASSRPAAVGSSRPAGARRIQERASQPSAARLKSASPMPAAPILPVSPLSNRVSEPKRRRDASRLGPRMSTQSDAQPASQPQRLAACRETPSLSTTTRPTAKRRRISRSPTYESSAAGFVWAATPRRSAPPSPFFSEIAAGDGRSQATGVSNAKTGGGGTQFAYATPHSGPIIVEGREHYNRPSGTSIGIGIGVTSSDGIGASHTNDRADHDIWEGVEDMPASAEMNEAGEEDVFDDAFRHSADEASDDDENTSSAASQVEDDECEQDDEDDDDEDDADDDRDNNSDDSDDDDDDDDSGPSL